MVRMKPRDMMSCTPLSSRKPPVICSGSADRRAGSPRITTSENASANSRKRGMRPSGVRAWIAARPPVERNRQARFGAGEDLAIRQPYDRRACRQRSTDVAHRARPRVSERRIFVHLPDPARLEDGALLVSRGWFLLHGLGAPRMRVRHRTQPAAPPLSNSTIEDGSGTGPAALSNMKPAKGASGFGNTRTLPEPSTSDRKMRWFVPGANASKTPDIVNGATPFSGSERVWKVKSPPYPQHGHKLCELGSAASAGPKGTLRTAGPCCRTISRNPAGRDPTPSPT